MFALSRRGASGHALNDLPSATLPNHTTMLTGIPAARHGVLVDFEIPGHVALRTIFDFAHDAGLRSAFFAGKSKLAYLAPPHALESMLIADPEDLVAPIVGALAPDGPQLLFVHLREPDSTGHRAGWMSDEYLAAVTRMDEIVAQLTAAAQADSTHALYLLITADHGGAGTNHFLNTPEDRRIPWILVGPDVPAGALIDAADLSTLDTAPTILSLLGLPLPPQFTGRERISRLRDADQPAAAPPDDSLPPIGPACAVLPPPILLALVSTLGFAALRGSRRQAARAAPPR